MSQRAQAAGSRSLSIPKILRAIATPICECGQCGRLEPTNVLSVMFNSGLEFEIGRDDGITKIVLTPATLKSLRDKVKKLENVDTLTGGKGPFFKRTGVVPNVKHVAEIETTEVLRIMAESAGVEVTIVERGFMIATAA